MTKIRLIYLFLLSTLTIYPFTQGYGQYFDSGQDPASLKWYIIKSRHFKVVFPDDFGKESQRFTRLLEESLPKVSESLNHPLRGRIPVLIHNHSALSNGMVNWAPKRMEIYPLAPQSNYPQDWLEQLAIHELRHAIQLDKLNTGLAHWLYYILGEQVTSLITGLYVPSWFLEGDAVVTETALSNTGRGRVPNFEMELRAQFVENKIFTYDKAVFGSYKNYTPDRYILGYYLVGTGRELFGKYLWADALKAITRNPFVPNPFNRGIKKVSGQTQGGLYYQCMQHLDSLWKKQDRLIQKTHFKKIKIRETSEYADYHFPAEMEDGAFFAIRNSMDETPKFVRIDSTGKISTLFTPGDVNEDALSFTDGKIYWAELIPDLRWDNRSWSVIRIFDVKSRKLRQLGKHTRWFAPTPTSDGKKIAVVDLSVDNKISLLVVDGQTGNIINRISTTENYLFMTPSWDDNNRLLVCILQGLKGKAIAEVSPEDGKIKILTPFTTVEISGPVYMKDKILFLGGFNGIDNVYTLDTVTREIKQLTSSRFGAHDASLSNDEKRVLYVDYTAHGHQIVETGIDEGLSIPLGKLKNTAPRLDSILSVQENEPVQFFASDSLYPVKPYRKITHLFDFHSWAPAYIDVSNTSLFPGLSIMSQNLLSTTFITLGYQYNRAEKTGKYTVDLSYKGFFPVMSLKYSNGIRASAYDPNFSGESIRFTYGEEELQGSLSLPLNLSRGKYYRGINPSAGITQFMLYRTPSSPGGLITYNANSLDLELTAYNILRSSDKDLLPRWGQIFQFQHRNHFMVKGDSARLTSATAEFYFPGFLRHHSWKLTFGYQEKQNSGYYGFSDFLGNPRGYSELPGKQFSTLSVDYALPLFYPEWSIPRFLYLKRIAADLFTDQAWNSGSTTNDYAAVGAELTAECNLFRFYAPLNLGFRTIYNTSTKMFSLEFLYSINLSTF